MANLIGSPWNSLLRSFNLPLQYNCASTRWSDVRETGVGAACKLASCVRNALGQVELLISPRRHLQNRVVQWTQLPADLAELVTAYSLPETPETETTRIMTLFRETVRSEAFQSAAAASVAGGVGAAAAIGAEVIGPAYVGIIALVAAVPGVALVPIEMLKEARDAGVIAAMVTVAETMGTRSGAGPLQARAMAVGGTVAACVAVTAIRGAREPGSRVASVARDALKAGRYAARTGVLVVLVTGVPLLGRLLVIESMAMLAVGGVCEIAARVKRAATGRTLPIGAYKAPACSVTLLLAASTAMLLATGRSTEPRFFIAANAVVAGGLTPVL